MVAWRAIVPQHARDDWTRYLDLLDDSFVDRFSKVERDDKVSPGVEKWFTDNHAVTGRSDYVMMLSFLLSLTRNEL